MIHIFPISAARAVSRADAEIRALFLAREATTKGGTESPTLQAALNQLVRSDNAAIANEARRLKALRP